MGRPVTSPMMRSATKVRRGSPSKRIRMSLQLKALTGPSLPRKAIPAQLGRKEYKGLKVQQARKEYKGYKDRQVQQVRRARQEPLGRPERRVLKARQDHKG